MARVSDLSVFAALLVLISVDTFSQTYTIQDLGVLPQARTSAAAAISSNRVVGTSGVPNEDMYIHAFLWTPKTGMQDLGTLPGGFASYGFGVNSYGMVVGAAEGYNESGYYQHGFRWTRKTGMQDLGTLPGADSSRAIGINGLGQIVGYASYPDFSRHAVLWDDSGTTDLGLRSGQAYSLATAISRRGDVVGTAGSNAALWRADGSFVNLGVLPGDSNSQAQGIYADRIVGYSVKSGKPIPFLWTRQKGMQSLGLLPGNTYGVATSIYGHQVVGYLDFTGGFIWTPEGGMKDLNHLITNGVGWSIYFANDINSAGQITGAGGLFGFEHAFLLTPVP